MDEEIEVMPTKTYLVSGGRIQGFIYEMEAMRQAVEKILLTQRFEDLIYFGDYGVETDRLIGQSIDFVTSDLQRTVSDALLTDDRIQEIQNFRIVDVTDDSIHCAFGVQTIHGLIEVERSIGK